MIPMPARGSYADQLAMLASQYLYQGARVLCESRPFSELGRVAGGSTPSTRDLSNWNGSIVWITPRDLGRPRAITVDRSERMLSAAAVSGRRRLLPAGSVLFSCRAPIGHVAVAGVDLMTNQGVKAMIASDELLNPAFLFHMLRASVPAISERGRGNTFAEITGGVLKQWEVPVPTLGTQEAIAGRLDCFYQRLAGATAIASDAYVLPQGFAHLESDLNLLESLSEVRRELETMLGETTNLVNALADEAPERVRASVRQPTRTTSASTA